MTKPARSLYWLVLTPETLALELVCHGSSQVPHADKPRRIAWVSWAPDGFGVMRHLLDTKGNRKRRQRGELRMGEPRAGGVVWLNEVCPLCANEFETPLASLEPLLKKYGRPGELVAHVK